MKNLKCTEINALVIDDNEVNLLILMNMLELFGIKAEQANSGQMALQKYKIKTYDLIFVDHLMPDMDGVHTTSAIRSTLSGRVNSIIVVLSSEITEQMRRDYYIAGANDFYEKPLALSDLLTILRKWFPDIKLSETWQKQEQRDRDKLLGIRKIIEELEEIDDNAAFIDVTANPSYFIHVLEATLKDLQSGIYSIVNSYQNESIKSLQMIVHKLKGVFGNIGATSLLEKTIIFENLLLEKDMDKIHAGYVFFLNDLVEFKEKLCYTLKKNNASLISDEQEYIPLSIDEYEQCLFNTIYYIRRYDYNAIVRELEQLILRGYDMHRQEFETALKDIKNFDYEKALQRMMRLKKETGNLPVPKNSKMIQLKNFWNEE